MNRPACLILAFLSISFPALFSNPESRGPAQEAAVVALRIDNQVIPGSDRNFLTDPRVFNAEFYRKFNSQLHLANDADATRDWTTKGAKACRRGSFLFDAPDYLRRYPDLAKGDCVWAAEHFVTAGFNEGRIGAFDSYWVVFDFNYYVDPANNPDLNKAYTSHVWNLVDLQIHWLQHGIHERRTASAFFSVSEYQARYADVSHDPARAIFEYVTDGQSKGRMGRAAWADPAAWSSLVQQRMPPDVSATASDVEQSFTSARGLPVKVVVKSPGWYRASLSCAWLLMRLTILCCPRISRSKRIGF